MKFNQGDRVEIRDTGVWKGVQAVVIEPKRVGFFQCYRVEIPSGRRVVVRKLTRA